MTHSTGSPSAITAPLFELPDTGGVAVRLEPKEHAATVVVFTANSCPFARAWHDRIQAVARDYADRDVAVLQLISNDETDHPEDSVEAMKRARRRGRARRAVPSRRGAVRRPGLRRDSDARGLRDRPRGRGPLPRRARRRPRRSGGERPLSPGGARRRARRSRGATTHHLTRRLLDEVACRAAVVGGLSDARRGCRPAPGHPRRAGPRRGQRRQARGAYPQGCTSSSASPAPPPSRSDGGTSSRWRQRPPSPAASTPGPTAACLPCRTPTELAGRLRESLARPWDLPGWVDSRKPRRTA